MNQPQVDLDGITPGGLMELTIRSFVHVLFALQLANFRAGKTNLSKFFMGQAFKATRGRADGKVVEECVMDLLRGHSPATGGER